ncbi:flagellar filament capping protein FliD [Alphaproteobacteria bacterium]|nr:flagellar filament capping protein FliD [Alphaproteobacteria bacterium]
MAVDYLSALNAGSGLNVTQIVDALVDAERTPKQTKIDAAKETATVKISALGSLKSELSLFDTTTSALNGQTGLSLSSSTENVILARTDSSLASEFSHTINVTQIAQSQVLNFDNNGIGFSSTTADISIDELSLRFGTWSGTDFTTNSDYDSATTFNFTAGETSLADVRDTINNASIGVTASIIEFSEGAYSLMLKSVAGKDRALRVKSHLNGSENNVLKYNPGNVSSFADTADQVVAASDAIFTVDGISVTRNSNTITDLFSGVTVELKSVTPSDIGTDQTISSSYSKSDALATLETVITEINYLLAFLKEQSKPGSNGEAGGPLNGDHFVRYIETKIKSLTSTPIKGYDDDDIYLSNFGVVTELDGTLSVDETRFTEYFTANASHFAAVTTTMIRTGDTGITGSAPTDLFIPGIYNFALSDGVATLTDAELNSDSMSVGTNKYGYADSNIGATGLLLETTQSSANTNVFMGRSILATLSDYIDDVLLMNGDIDKKIVNLENDVDSLIEDQEALDLQIESQRALYLEKFTAMQTAVSSFKKTGEFLDNLIKSWNSDN